MGFLNNMMNPLPAYQPVVTGPTDQNYSDTVQNNTAYANRPASSFQSDLNQNVKEQSNLMGPRNPQDSNSEAMNARADQLYSSQVNNLMKQSQNAGVARQNQLQSMSIDQQAALYTNLQSRANINWQQLAYQRQAAIVQEANRRALYAGLFGGIGSLLGAGAAGLANARTTSPTEPTPQQQQQAVAETQAYGTVPGTGMSSQDYINLPESPYTYSRAGSVTYPNQARWS